MNPADGNKKQLSIERAAFLILRVRRAFRRKLNSRHKNNERSNNSGANVKPSAESGSVAQKPTMTRSRTLPSIVLPSLSISQVQIDTNSSLTRWYNSKIGEASALLSARSNGDLQDLWGSTNVNQSCERGSSHSCNSSPGGNYSEWLSLAGAKNKTRLPRFLNNRAEKMSPHNAHCRSPMMKVLPNESVVSPITIHLQAPTPVLSQRRRRHSLESNNDSVSRPEQPNTRGRTFHQLPDVTASSSARSLMTLSLGVPDAGPSAPNSPGTNKRSSKTSNERKKDSSLELLVHGLHLTKGDLKKMEKLTKINIHLHALFAAVEFGQVEKARAILEDNEIDINSCNSDRLSLLDVAVLSNNNDMVRLLIHFGAKEGNEFSCKEALNLHLIQLLNAAEKKLEEKGVSSLYPVKNEEDKHIALWKRRVRIVRRMKSALDLLKVPHSPNQARVEVVGENSAQIWWLQPDVDAKTLCTKFKVQWSTHPDFVIAGGEVEVRDLIWKGGGDELNEIRVVVPDCPFNQRCYFRVAAGNLSGYGAFKTTLPSSVLLSAWRSIDGRKSRFDGRLPMLDDLFSKVRDARPDYASEIRRLEDASSETPVKQRKNTTKINLRQFFGANVKFQKNLRRGVYFACIVFYEDKLLVTTEEFPPVVEIDDTYPASVNNDFHWLMKIGCTWSDVKTLRQDMERNSSSSSSHFRIKLLQAAAQLQSALGLQDLGQLYYQPLKDRNGTMVISSTCHLANIKAIPSSLNFKWLPLSKLQRRVLNNEESNASDLLLASLQEQISFLQDSNRSLKRGLYLGFLKMKSSVDLIRVLVPKESPNLLPHSKIRDNPWVSSEEWQWIKKLFKSQKTSESDVEEDKSDCKTEEFEHPKDSQQPTTAQLLFQSQIQRAANKLLTSMGIYENVQQHRIYEDEVIELSADVSVILLLPPPESVCAVAGQNEALFHRPEFLSVPVQVFEMIHLRTYQRDLIGRYSRLSSILELDTNLAQLALREAFSSVELAEAKQRISRLQDLQVQVDSTWRGSRWIMDVLSLARERTVTVGVPIGAFSQQSRENEVAPEETTSSQGSALVRTELERPNKQRVLLKAKSDNKILCSLPPTSSDVLVRTQVRSRTPVCMECAVPLDLPGYISSCESCSCSRTRYNQPGSGELFKKHSRSNETLPTPPLGFTAHQTRKAISRSENQLNSIEFQPFLDAEGCDSTPPPTVLVESNAEGKKADGEATEPAAKLDRGGSKRELGGSMRSNSQESETSHISRSSHTPSLNSLSSAEGDPDSGSTLSADAETGHPSLSGIIQVYAAYESGLANGTSVKLHVTARTSAREVVDLVVRQLNMAVVVKGKEGPVYTAEEFKTFCLVAVIGARERCLRDDFRPLHLQNPWKKGRLFVRQKKDVLAAIEQSGRQPHPPAVV